MAVDNHNDLHEAKAASATCEIVLDWLARVGSTHCTAHCMCPQTVHYTAAYSAVQETETKGRGP